VTIRLAQLLGGEVETSGFTDLHKLFQPWIAAQQFDLLAKGFVLANAIDEQMRDIRGHRFALLSRSARISRSDGRERQAFSQSGQSLARGPAGLGVL